MWRLVLGDLLPDLGEVEDPLPGAARVDGVGEQRLVVVRADEAGVAVLLQQQHVHVLGRLVVGVPGHNSISWTVRSRLKSIARVLQCQTIEVNFLNHI